MEWAKTLPAKHPPVTIDRLGVQMEFMAAALPSRSTDDEMGKRKAAVYARVLGGYSDRAIQFMAMRACETLKWFPTPSECLEILKGHIDAPTERDQVMGEIKGFWSGKFDGWIDSLSAGLATDATVAEVPEQWRKIAMERGFLRLIEDGSYIIRRRAMIGDQSEGDQ